MLQQLQTQGVTWLDWVEIDYEVLRPAVQAWVDSRQSGQAELVKITKLDKGTISRYLAGGPLRQPNARLLLEAIGLSPVPKRDPFAHLSKGLIALGEELGDIGTPLHLRLASLAAEIDRLNEKFPALRDFVEGGGDGGGKT